MELVSTMQELWEGAGSTANKAPRIVSMKLHDGTLDTRNLYLRTGSNYSATLEAQDLEGDSLRVAWEVLPETIDETGDKELTVKPASISNVLLKATGNTLTLRAPTRIGAYRLFAYVYDGQGNVATANIPFYVNRLGKYAKDE